MRVLLIACMCGLSLAMLSCQEEHEHTAPAIHDRDSVAVMTTYGVNTLISDSGVIKYRIIAERWEVNQNRKPSRWTFDKGVLLTQFDLRRHVVGFIQADTAVYYDQERRWVLRGRVHIKTAQGMDFRSQQLYWDERNHEIWSNAFSHLITPERELEGNWFHSDEQMTKYEIRRAKGWTLFDEKEFGSGGGPHPLPPDTTNSRTSSQPVPGSR